MKYWSNMSPGRSIKGCQQFVSLGFLPSLLLLVPRAQKAMNLIRPTLIVDPAVPFDEYQRVRDSVDLTYFN
jgi:hypothetical protein